jgi:DNA-binding SARP family transcriptional activator
MDMKLESALEHSKGGRAFGSKHYTEYAEWPDETLRARIAAQVEKIAALEAREQRLREAAKAVRRYLINDPYSVPEGARKTGQAKAVIELDAALAQTGEK